MKKHSNIIITIMSAIIFIAGIGIFSYPLISNLIISKQQEKVIQTYTSTIDNESKEVIKEQYQKAKEYNENLAGDPLHDPFVPNSGYAMPNNYYDILNINNDGVMGYINIPCINVNLPIYHGTSDEVLEKGAGHMEGTYLPIGGKNRFSVISAHCGLPSAELFTRLDEVEIGDVFSISVLDKKLYYKVYDISVIEPEDLSKIKGLKNKDIITLLTCTPYGVNSHRLLVSGERISNSEGKTIEDNTTVNIIPDWMKNYLIAIIIGILILLFIIYYVKRKKER